MPDPTSTILGFGVILQRGEAKGGKQRGGSKRRGRKEEGWHNCTVPLKGEGECSPASTSFYLLGDEPVGQRFLQNGASIYIPFWRGDTFRFVACRGSEQIVLLMRRSFFVQMFVSVFAENRFAIVWQSERILLGGKLI